MFSPVAITTGVPPAADQPATERADGELACAMATALGADCVNEVREGMEPVTVGALSGWEVTDPTDLAVEETFSPAAEAERPMLPVAVRSSCWLELPLNGLLNGFSENLATSVLQAPSAPASMPTLTRRTTAEDRRNSDFNISPHRRLRNTTYCHD
jgi:hypothetical protein